MKNLSEFLDGPRSEYAPWEVFKAQKPKPQAVGPKVVKPSVNITASKEMGHLCCFEGCDQPWTLAIDGSNYCREHFRNRK